MAVVRVTSDSLQYKNLGKVQLSLDNDTFDSASTLYSLICSSNEYGYMYVGCGNKILAYNNSKVEGSFNDEVETNFGEDCTCNLALAFTVELKDFLQTEDIVDYKVIQLSLSNSERYLAVVIVNFSSNETKVLVIHLENFILSHHLKHTNNEVVEMLSIPSRGDNLSVVFLSWSKVGAEKLAVSTTQPTEIKIFNYPFTNANKTNAKSISLSNLSSATVVDWSPIASDILLVTIQNSLKAYRDTTCIASSASPLLRPTNQFCKSN